MALVPLPSDATDLISRKAISNVRSEIYRRGWKSASALRPTYGDGAVGIQSTVNYLLIQNRGFAPFVMWWVKNRTVPLGCKMGDGPHFRFGNPDAVGTAGYVDVPHKGRTFKPIRWRHPGLQPKRFMEKSIQKAIKDSKMEIRQSVMDALKGGQR